MEKNEKLDINSSCLTVLSCVQSLRYIVEDLDDMEIQANNVSEGCYRGLANIVDQLTARMEGEMKIIIEGLEW